MPNVTSVWDFSPGETLTAAKLDDVNCGIHVFSGTATRDAAYGGSGERSLSEGEFAYLADTNTTQYYDGAAWQTVGGGLTLIKAQTIGSAVSTVTVTNAFSATYDNYKIVVSGGTGSASTYLKMTLGATSTGYYWAYLYRTYAGTSSGDQLANGAFWLVGTVRTDGLKLNMDIQNPFASAVTGFQGFYETPATGGDFNTGGGYLNNTTSYTDFTLAPNTGTITGGTIRVYGYQNS